jgi:tetratricopeptide (TPR) repeat protein
MACPDENRLVEYVEGLLPEDGTRAVETHIDSCESCRRVLANFAIGSHADAAPEPFPEAGERYTIHDVVGTGAMSVVYAATDRVLDRKVAFKVLRDPDPAQAARLQREAQAMAKLAHPNVLPVHDVGLADGRMFLTAELVAGRTLAEWLAQTPRTSREIVSVFVQAGRGLAAAHAAGITHRDFKPSNVLVGDDGRVRVADFGLAARPAETSGGQLVGTPAYMAPEQLAGEPADARSDQFGFCVALFEALYGERPFAAKDLAGLRHAIERGPVVPRARRVPRALRRIVLGGLAIDPAQRHASMDALCDQLVRSQRRTRVVWLAVPAVAAATTIVLLARGGSAPTCAAPAWRGTWDPVRHAELSLAFARTRSPVATEATRAIAAGLDRTTAAWSSAYVGVCEDTEVRHERSARMLDVAMACLSERRERVAALVDVLATGDADVVAHAATAIDQLGDPAECADSHRLLEQPDLPADPAARAKIAELRAALARGGALLATGKYRDAIALVSALDVTSASSRQLEAERGSLLGTLYAQSGDARHAERALLDAISAAQAAGDSAVTATAALQLAYTLGNWEMRFAEARRWAQLASGAIERLGGDKALAAKLAMTLGSVAMAEGDFKEARAQYKHASELLRAIGGDHDTSYALAIYGIGLGKLRGDDAAGALLDLDRARAILEPTLGHLHPRIADVLTDRSRALQMLDRMPEAEHDVRDALAIKEAVFGPDNPQVAVTLLELAGLLNDTSRFQDALPVAARARTIWEHASDEYDAALALDAEGVANAGQGKLDVAREQLERVLAIEERVIGPDHPDLATPLAALAQVYETQGDKTKLAAAKARLAKLTASRAPASP